MDRETLAAVSSAITPLCVSRGDDGSIRCEAGPSVQAAELRLARRRARSQHLSLPGLQRDAAAEALRRAREVAPWLDVWREHRGFETERDLCTAAHAASGVVARAVRSAELALIRATAAMARDSAEAAISAEAAPGLSAAEQHAVHAAGRPAALARVSPASRAGSLVLAARGTRDWKHFVDCAGRDLDAKIARVRMAVTAGDMLARRRLGGMDGAWFMGPMYVDNAAFEAAGRPADKL
ncbi:hypothetical protein FNF29_04881 [Cafeteria roenbergensis]|uniref:Uncharacterized protein n=1 Tax=Cafeteria roenbergensis TaxID=33653 RepID=A0A5A8CGN8_CAFRO|nr:hypothetical protein FNF29_04881 [Cafeteria roenbergensis]|eukprot:KAA0150991.1 hypothetical protein FNF29_04881 [Cafeteria roenbergensis]